MIHLILLAAGSARRFGEDKLVWPIEGKPMICHILDKLEYLAIENAWDLTVVTREGPAADLASFYSAKIILNADHNKGISTSIRCGLSSLPDDHAPAVFFVADQPWLSLDTVADFISGFHASDMKCGCVIHKGETGNPCIFAHDLFSELMQLEGDRGGKRVLMRHIDECYMHEVADAVQLTDIDTKPET